MASISADNAPQWLRNTVVAIRTATTVAALTSLIGFGTLNMLAEPDSEPQQLGLSARPLDQMMQHNRCSFTGFGSDVIPSKAVIRTPAGETRLVTFDEGWAVFNGDAAGDLVAVCLGPDKAARKG